MFLTALALGGAADVSTDVSADVALTVALTSADPARGTRSLTPAGRLLFDRLGRAVVELESTRAKHAAASDALDAARQKLEAMEKRAGSPDWGAFWAGAGVGAVVVALVALAATSGD